MTTKSELIYILINFAQKKRDKVVEVIHYNFVLFGGYLKCYSHWKIVLQKAKHRIIIWPSNSAPKYVTQNKNSTQANSCTKMVIAALLTIVNRWK